VDELDERVDAAVRLNDLIRATGEQIQQLLQEYARCPGATVAGHASLNQQALITLQELSDLKKRLLGQEGK
jgi:hypothetical protein